MAKNYESLTFKIEATEAFRSFVNELSYKVDKRLSLTEVLYFTLQAAKEKLEDNEVSQSTRVGEQS